MEAVVLCKGKDCPPRLKYGAGDLAPKAVLPEFKAEGAVLAFSKGGGVWTIVKDGGTWVSLPISFSSALRLARLAGGSDLVPAVVERADEYEGGIIRTWAVGEEEAWKLDGLNIFLRAGGKKIEPKAVYLSAEDARLMVELDPPEKAIGLQDLPAEVEDLIEGAGLPLMLVVDAERIRGTSESIALWVRLDGTAGWGTVEAAWEIFKEDEIALQGHAVKFTEEAPAEELKSLFKGLGLIKCRS